MPGDDAWGDYEARRAQERAQEIAQQRRDEEARAREQEARAREEEARAREEEARQHLQDNLERRQWERAGQARSFEPGSGLEEQTIRRHYVARKEAIEANMSGGMSLEDACAEVRRREQLLVNKWRREGDPRADIVSRLIERDPLTVTQYSPPRQSSSSGNRPYSPPPPEPQPSAARQAAEAKFGEFAFSEIRKHLERTAKKEFYEWRKWSFSITMDFIGQEGIKEVIKARKEGERGYLSRIEDPIQYGAVREEMEKNPPSLMQVLNYKVFGTPHPLRPLKEFQEKVGDKIGDTWEKSKTPVLYTLMVAGGLVVGAAVGIGVKKVMNLFENGPKIQDKQPEVPGKKAETQPEQPLLKPVSLVHAEQERPDFQGMLAEQKEQGKKQGREV